MSNNKRLLREYIQQIIKEDYGGGDISGMGGWGFSSYGKPLGVVFVKPFVDVFMTAKAGLTKVATRFKTLLKVALETLLTTIIPVLQSNYQLIFKQEKEELKKIKEKYADVFKANDAAFTEDVMVLSFMLNPAGFLSAKIASHTPDVIMSTLEIFSHGSENLQKYFDDVNKRLDAIKKDIEMDPEKFKVIDVAKDKQAVVPVGHRGTYFTKKKLNAESIQLFEASSIETAFQQEKTKYLEQIVNDSNLKKMIASSTLAKQMSADAKHVAIDFANKVLQEAQHVLSANSLEDLMKISKKQLDVSQFEQIPEQEREAAKQQVLQQAKAAMKAFYVKTIQLEINALLNKGVDSNNLYITSLNDTLSKITSLKG